MKGVRLYSNIKRTGTIKVTSASVIVCVLFSFLVVRASRRSSSIIVYLSLGYSARLHYNFCLYIDE